MDVLAVDIPTAAAMLSQSETWIKAEIASGRLKSVKRGRSRRIRMDDLRAFNATRDDSRVTQIGPARRRRRPASLGLPPTDEPMPLPEYGS